MHCFRYRWSKILRIDFSIIILLAITFIGIVEMKKGEWRSSALLMLVGYTLFVPFYINARLLVSSICIDAEAIKWCIFGFAWKTITWREAKRIRRLRSYNISARREINTYCVDLNLNRKLYLLKRGPIIFDETIGQFGELLTLINKYAAGHRISIVACINKDSEQLDRL